MIYNKIINMNNEFVSNFSQLLSNYLNLNNNDNNNNANIMFSKYYKKFKNVLEENDLNIENYEFDIDIVLKNKIDIFDKESFDSITDIKEVVIKNYTTTLDECEDPYLIYMVSFLYRMDNKYLKAIEYLDYLVSKFNFIHAIIDLGEYYELYNFDYNKAEQYYQKGLDRNNKICIRGLCYCYIKTKNDLLLEATIDKLRELKDYEPYPDIIKYYFTNRKNDMAMYLILEGIENKNYDCFYNLAIYHEKVYNDIYQTTISFINGINSGSKNCLLGLNTYLNQFYKNELDIFNHILAYKEYIKLNPLYSKIFINTLEIYLTLFDENDKLVLDEQQIKYSDNNTENNTENTESNDNFKYQIYTKKNIDDIEEFILNSKLVKYYKSSKSVKNIKEQCFICSTTKDECKKLESVILDCEHYMCLTCFKSVVYKNECPYCRINIYDNKDDLQTINKLFNLPAETEELNYDLFTRYFNNVYNNTSVSNNVQQEENSIEPEINETENNSDNENSESENSENENNNETENNETDSNNSDNSNTENENNLESFTLELTPDIINNNEFMLNLQNILRSVNPNFNLSSISQYIQTPNTENTNSNMNENNENLDSTNENNIINESNNENLDDSNNNFIDHDDENSDYNSDDDSESSSYDEEINPMDNLDTYSEYLNEEEHYYNSDNE